jgi:hypothetical protein
MTVLVGPSRLADLAPCYHRGTQQLTTVAVYFL